jgi:uncharacterized protein YbaA (DUF1428 family)
MSYIDGFVAAVPTDGQDAYLEHARVTGALFREFGATRTVECWGDDVKDGHTTDFRRAVQAKDDETVVFAWMEWPNKAVRDAGMARLMADDRMRDMPMPFDGKRMIYGGFSPIVDERPGGAGGYVDGFLVPVPADKRDAYRDTALAGFPIFRDHGIVRHVEGWADDVPAGEVTDFFRAVQATADERVVFSWFEWPDRSARDKGAAGFMADPRMEAMSGDMPFDGKRMVYGGFSVILDEGATA